MQSEDGGALAQSEGDVRSQVRMQSHITTAQYTWSQAAPLGNS